MRLKIVQSDFILLFQFVWSLKSHADSPAGAGWKEAADASSGVRLGLGGSTRATNENVVALRKVEPSLSELAKGCRNKNERHAIKHTAN